MGNLLSVLETLKPIITFDIVRRLFFLAAVAASVAVGIGLYHWVQEPVYQPLPYYVDEKNLPLIMQTLEKANILYKLDEYGHHVSIPLDDLSAAKRALSMAGVSKDDGFNFSYLNDDSKFGNSQFLDNVRYIRALESDLARTIAAIQGISGAKVHLAIPQHNIFADESVKPSASIIVNFLPGYQDDKEKIRAIVQLVAASVPELDPTSIAITDQYGHYLSDRLDRDALLNREQLDYQNNLQNYYEKKIRSLIVPIVGANKTSISVNIDLDFTQTEEAQEAYDPNQAVIRSEQNTTENNGGSSGSGATPGSLSNQPPTSKGQPASSGNNTGDSRTEVVKNYEISKSTKYVKLTAPKVKSISVALIVDDQSVYDEKTKKSTVVHLSKAKLQQLTELVQSSIGYNQTRGDRVTVINSQFISEVIATPPPLSLFEKPGFLEWSKRLIGIILGFVFLFIMYRKFSSDFKPASALNKADVPVNASGSGKQWVTPEMLALKDEQLKILKDLAAKDPNKVAHVLKQWIVS